MPDLAQSTFILPQDATLTSEQSALEQRIWTLSTTITTQRHRIY